MAVRITLKTLGRRGFASALFVSDRSTKVRPILTPQLNLADKFANVQKLQETIKIRGMDADAAALKSLWELHGSLHETRDALEKRRIEIASQIKDIKKVAAGKEADTEIEKLKTEGRFVREDLKNLLQAYWDVEERMMESCLALPNDLHPKTPIQDDLVHIQHGGPTKPNPGNTNHLISGKNLIDYRDPHWHYLKSSAAIFDLALPSYFVDGLKSQGFSNLVPPDFAHSAVVEGCGVVDDILLLAPAEENLNLVGGASLFSILAQYAKQTLPLSRLPLLHVVGGKRYLKSANPGLFGAWQHTCVDFAVISTDVNNHLDECLEDLVNLYKRLGWSFEVVLISAPNLKPWESFRASFQMFSHSLGRNVEVGSLSVSGSFISERLAMEYVNGGGEEGFCQVLSGTAVDATNVLACLLETDSPVLFPKVLEPYSYGTL